MSKQVLLCLIALFFITEVNAQDGFFSRLYFPMTYGIHFPINAPKLDRSTIASTGLEYRFKSKIPWYIRFSFDNSSFDYTIGNNLQTNVVKSELKINGYYLGGGIRTNTGKWKLLALVQVGSSNYKYPTVKNYGNNYELKFSRHNSISYKALLGIEYYMIDKIAVNAEAFYLYTPSSTVFWNDNFQCIGVKAGITATLF